MSTSGASTDDRQQQQRSFTQADVDRIVSDRLQAEREQMTALRRELRDAQGQLGERGQTQEQLERRVETLTRERNEAREQTKTATERALASQMRAEVTAAATRAGAVDADDVYRLLPQGAVTVNAETGAFEGVDAAVSQLSESKPHLFTPPQRPGPSDGGARESAREHEHTEPSMNDLIRRAAGRS
jgi:TolA-binding protein